MLDGQDAHRYARRHLGFFLFWRCRIQDFLLNTFGRMDEPMAAAPTTRECGILFTNDGLPPNDQHGCRLPVGHDCPHEFVDENGTLYRWETDWECNCEHCLSGEGDLCSTYWRANQDEPLQVRQAAAQSTTEQASHACCQACQQRGKTWQGEDPRCAFEGGAFSADNWSCATAGLIRDLCYEGKTLPHGVAYQYCGDQKYATIKTEHVDGISGALALWVTWYKSRGTTDAMWLLFDDQPPRAPTEAECLLIAQAYGAPVPANNATPAQLELLP